VKTSAGKKRRLLIAAGPTRERIDPVRFLSNDSTGTFGYAIAREARRRGHRVVLVTGPVALHPPAGVHVIQIETARQMRRAILDKMRRADCVIMAAAVSDWRPSVTARRKMKSGRRVSVALVPNPDILAEVGRKKGSRFVVGFALETEDLERNARKKLIEKNLDMIVANATGPGKSAFGAGTTTVMIIDRCSFGKKIHRGSKKELSGMIIDRIEERMAVL